LKLKSQQEIFKGVETGIPMVNLANFLCKVWQKFQPLNQMMLTCSTFRDVIL